MTERTLEQWCLAGSGPDHLDDPKMSEGLQVRKVLVVDDEPDVEPMFRQRMRREVRAGMYEFLFALSGRPRRRCWKSIRISGWSSPTSTCPR